jgi:hypothetical protein
MMTARCTRYCRSRRFPRQPLSVPQPRGQQEQPNQRQREEDGAATAVNDAIDHVRPDVHAEQADDQDAERVPQDSQRNYEDDQHPPSSRAAEEHAGRRKPVTLVIGGLWLELDISVRPLHI